MVAIPIEQAIREFDRSAVAPLVAAAEQQRQEVVRRFPREEWPTMAIERYAVGLSGHRDTFCRLLEFQTPDLGSIKGGSSRKLIIYKHKDKPGWYFPNDFTDERAAWEAVRAGFLRAFEYADEGRWDDIQGIEPLNRGASLLTKTLWAYFPTELLPITSSDNLRHFLRIASRSDAADDQSLGTVQLNRVLLQSSAVIQSSPLCRPRRLSGCCTCASAPSRPDPEVAARPLQKRASENAPGRNRTSARGLGNRCSIH